MNSFYSFVLVLAFVGASLAFTAEFIPKSFYVIHSNGERSPVVNFRPKRSLQEPLFPLVPEVRRMRRSSGTGSGSGSGSFSSSYASSGAGGGAGANDAIYFDNLAAGFEAVAKLAGFPNGFPSGIPTGAGAGTAGAGFPSGGGGSAYGADAGHGIGAPNLHSRFGGDDGVSYSGTADGAKGVYSASSSSIDSDGNVKYSVKTGKF